MKKVGVTGGMGFIGRYVVEELQANGITPVIFDHHTRSKDEYPQDVEVFVGDVRDPIAMTELAAHVDGIVHLAACLGTQETIRNPRPAAETNLMGGLNFLEAVTQYDIAGVYIAVGNHWMNNSYSITKTATERFVSMYNKDRGSKVNVVRAVNAYGPRQLAAEPFAHGKVRKITPAFVCRALSGMPIEVYGDGEQVSDMVYVGDVAKALVRSLLKAHEGIVFDRVVEVGPKDNKTVNEVAKEVIQTAVNKGYEEVPLVHLPMRPGEIAGDRVTADYTSLSLVDMSESELVNLKDGLDKTVDYFIATKGDKWHDS
jgi:UDP-glucose 4-epimerase